ncbi:unnamed protein product [Prorocentrum cordatum]|uniref:Uncharacterized protein n=1 Tax=Prorocentrum cordatum TaxID=2364126 RepID=A0ABN9PVV3_9DINO|nr:unnamed protein product [Polarella glacialis]
MASFQGVDLTDTADQVGQQVLPPPQPAEPALTDEQRARIAENRARARRIRESRGRQEICAPAAEQTAFADSISDARTGNEEDAEVMEVADSGDESIVADLQGAEQAQAQRPGGFKRSVMSTDSLTADLDEAFTQKSQKKASLPTKCHRWFTNGASTLSELIDWFPQVINKISMMSKLPGQDVDYINNFRMNMEAKLVITESYAGAGNCGSVAAYIFGRASDHFSQSFSQNLYVYAAWDKGEVPLKVLAAHSGRGAPERIFADIMDRVPQDSREMLEALVAERLSSFKKLKDDLKGTQQHPPALSQKEFEDIKTSMAGEFVKELNEILSQISFLDSAFCVKHNRRCKISPRSDPRFKTCRWLECAGVTCNPWCAIGSHNNFLDESTLPALTWAHSTRFYEPDDVIMENAPSFKVEPFQEILNASEVDSPPDWEPTMASPKDPLSRPLLWHEGEGARLYCLFQHRFSPVDLGFPTSRKRVYAWFHMAGTIHTLSEDTMNHVFEEMFFRNCVTDARVFMAASSDDATFRSHVMGWAQKRQAWGIFDLTEESQAAIDVGDSHPREAAPPSSAASSSGAGGAGEGRVLLPVSQSHLDLGPFGDAVMKVRLHQNLERADCERCLEAKVPIQIVNLFQNDLFFGVSKYAPSLLQRSMLFDIISMKEILPIEHLLIQGFPVPQYVANDAGQFFPFKSIVMAEYPPVSEDVLQCAELRSICGVGFSWPAIGAVLMMVLATSHSILRTSATDSEPASPA